MEQPVYEADPRRTYLIRYKASPFANGQFDIEVDPKTGRLTKVAMTANDKLDEITVEIAKAVAASETTEEEGETCLDNSDMHALIDSDPRQRNLKTH